MLLSLFGRKALEIYEWISARRTHSRVGKRCWCEEKPNFHSISANNIIEEDQLSGALLLLGTVFPFQLWLLTLLFHKNGKRTINLQAAYVFDPNTIDTICMTHTMSE